MTSEAAYNPNLTTAIKQLRGAEFERSERGLKSVITGLEKSGIENIFEYGLALQFLAKIHATRADYKLALDDLDKLRTFLKERLGPDHPELAIANRKVAQTYLSVGNKEQSEKLFRRAFSGWMEFINPAPEPPPEEAQDLETLYGIKNNDNYVRTLFDLCRAKGSVRFMDGQSLCSHAMLELGIIHFARGYHKHAKEFLVYATKDLEEQKQNLSELNAQAYEELGRIEQSENNFPSAEAHLLQSLYIYQQTRSPDHPDIAFVLLDLAEIALADQRGSDARELAGQVRKSLIESLGDDSPQLATSLKVLAMVEESENNLLNAEMLQKQALQLFSTTFSDNHPEVIDSLTRLAKLLIQEKKYSEAETILYRTIDVAGSLIGAQPLPIADLYADLGFIYFVQARYAKAESVLQKEIRIRDMHLRTGHPDQARTLISIGKVNLAWGRYQDADANFKRAAGILERDRENNDLLHSTSLRGLAHIAIKQGRYAEAEAILKQRLEIEERLHINEESSLAEDYLDLGLAAALQYKLNNARKQLKAGLDIAKEGSPEQSQLLARYGDLQTIKGDFDAAGKSYQKAGNQEMFGQAYVPIVQALRRQAIVFELAGRPMEAERTLHNALEICDKQLEGYPASRVQTTYQLASLALRLHKASEAFNFYKDALNHCERQLGANHPLLADTLTQVAEYHFGINENGTAAQYYMRALRILDAVLGSVHPELISILLSFSRIYLGDEPEKAETLLQRAVSVANQSVGPYDPGTLTAEAALASFYEQQNKKPAAKQLQDKIELAWKQATDEQKTLMPEVGSYLKSSIFLPFPPPFLAVGYREPRLLFLDL
jgi:Tetratricopeptide repeat/MalT-like TPR region